MSKPLPPPAEFLSPQASPTPVPKPEPLGPPKPLKLSPDVRDRAERNRTEQGWAAWNRTELPVAPPELMIPAGSAVPGKHGTFGSLPITLSRDYPSLSELCGWPSLRGILAGSDGPLSGWSFLQVEYWLAWMTGLNIPVLGTTNTRGGFGFLGEPGTLAILGPGEFIPTDRSGFRIRGGTQLGCSGKWGLEGSFFFLGRRTAEVELTSDRYPIITRPVFSPNPRTDGTTIGETGEAVTVPGILVGGLSARAESLLWGFDANLRCCLFSNCGKRVEGLLGFRNVNLVESLAVTENISVVGPGGNRVELRDPVGTVVTVQDFFGTTNRFYGGQLGTTFERRWDRLTLEGRACVALGVTCQELEIAGFQYRVRPGMPPMTFPGGLLAAGPNLGSFSRHEFSVVPEVTVNAGLWLTRGLRLYTGFNFLYWTNVIRPGDQIDRVVDLTFVPNAPSVAFSGQLRPRPLFRQSDLWVTALLFGVECRW